MTNSRHTLSVLVENKPGVLTRFTGLIAVTAATREELEAAVAEVSRAAIQSGCETRRLYGQQARAFVAAALPLARKVN